MEIRVAMFGAGLVTAWNLKAIFKTTSLIIRLLILNRVHLRGTFGSFPIHFMPLSYFYHPIYFLNNTHICIYIYVCVRISSKVKTELPVHCPVAFHY